MNRRDTLLIVDDMEINRAILGAMFESEYNVLEAENGERALLLLQQYQSRIAAVLLDLMMPVKSGYEVMEEMGRGDLLSQIPVIVITSEDGVESEARAFDLGASDIVMKPFESHAVKRRVRNIVELYRHKLNLEDLVEEQAATLRESNSIMIDALSSVIEYRSLESGQHIRRIRFFTQILLRDVARSYPEYNLDERVIRIITDASAMHDIGKIAIPDSILNKPGPLTAEEFEVMKTHTVKGCEILSGLDPLRDREYLRYAYHICRYHHERWDGRGYPEGLKGENIPICAQVVAVADCYDALTTDRVYKRAIPQARAFNMILNGECGAFSPRLLECFKNVREEFARLSQEYADGRSVAPKSIDRLPPVRTGEERSTLEQGQMKYFALLRYLDSTVMEVDLSTGLYHLVYQASDDFNLLRSGGRFEDSVRAFAEESVHPEDRERVLRLSGDYLENFLDEGLRKLTCEFRIFSRSAGEYRRYAATLLRTDAQSPRERHVLLIWSLLPGEPSPPAPGVRSVLGRDPILGRLLEGVYQMANDKWLTLLEVSDNFHSLAGYSQEELRTRFHNRFLEIVCPADRASLWEQMRQQGERGNLYEMEFRIRAKDGRVVWVLSRSVLAEAADGRESFYGILVDVTKSKQAQEELRLSLERHQIILSQTNDIIFEWDIVADSLSFSANWEGKYGYAPLTEQVSSRLLTASHIHPDDSRLFIELMRSVQAGVPYGEVEFRLAQADGRYRWCRIRATTQFDENRRPFKAVGIITDIDEEKRAAQKLLDRAERDTLTGLYHKEAGRTRIEWHFDHGDPKKSSAMMIIDVDNFKVINDRFGHMFGDAVLSEMAGIIGETFGRHDVVARIGGDEFLAFLTDIRNEKEAVKLARKIIAAIGGMQRENLQGTLLSCSVGIAYFPGDGKDFQTLFRHADEALYEAKATGKNRCCVFRENLSRLSGSPRRLFAERTVIDSELVPEYNLPGLIFQVFQLLYDDDDFDRAVQSILSLLGGVFNVSRVYVFENTADDTHCNNTYEWCNEGIAPEKHNLQNFPYANFGDRDYRCNFDEGIFYCPNVRKLPEALRAVLEPQGVLSLLQCAILDGGAFKGFVGFDDCRIRRLWTRDQIDTLVFVARLLSVFLIKKRTQDRLDRLTAEDAPDGAPGEKAAPSAR